MPPPRKPDPVEPPPSNPPSSPKPPDAPGMMDFDVWRFFKRPAPPTPEAPPVRSREGLQGIDLNDLYALTGTAFGTGRAPTAAPTGGPCPRCRSRHAGPPGGAMCAEGGSDEPDPTAAPAAQHCGGCGAVHFPPMCGGSHGGS